MTRSLAALLVPEVRWDPQRGFAWMQGVIDDALELGVGGFVIGNGPRAEVAALVAALQRDARHPLLIAAAAERGAGGAFDGLTGLPPAGALGALRDDDVVRRAARLTASELRGLGVNWALAPCADLAWHAANPALGARAFGADAQRVAEWVATWVDACQAEGVLAGALHLPGLGRLHVDATLTPCEVPVDGATLWTSDLVPFRAAADAGVATVLVSHVSYKGLDASGVGAAHSPLILREMMRGELQYEGLLVSDLPSDPAAAGGMDEAADAVAAVRAGCDLVLAPRDLARVADALDAAVAQGLLDADEVEASLARRAFWAQWARAGAAREPTLDDVLWARQVADTVVHAVRGVFTNIGPVVDVIQVDDDDDRVWTGGDRFRPFLATLRAIGHAPRVVPGPTDEGRGAVVIAIRGEPAFGRGRAGYRESTRRQVARAVAESRHARRPVVAVVFGPPALAAEIPEVPNVICAWGGDRAMQEAAARRLA